MKPMSLEDAKRDLAVFQRYDIHNKAREYLESLIWQMEQATPCDWCNGVPHRISDGDHVTLWIEGSYLVVDADCGETLASKINQCPNCGRIFVPEEEERNANKSNTAGRRSQKP